MSFHERLFSFRNYLTEVVMATGNDADTSPPDL